MCGIVGIIGTRTAGPAMLESLRRLEYRGYDSAGVATVVDGRIERRRAVGKLSELTRVIDAEPIDGLVGIGHTRWATHGAPTEANAHPHATDRVAVVHNGIIENFRELRDELEDRGARFTSETDTETVARLVDRYLDEGDTPIEATMRAVARLRGAFALCFVFEGQADLLIAARRGSPLAVGYGDGEMFVGSDALALAPFTRRVTYLEEGDVAVLSRTGVEITDADGKRANRPVDLAPAEIGVVDKGGHAHFMAKEIHEQPTVARGLLTAYTTPADHGEARRFTTPDASLSFDGLDGLSIVACGTAHYAGAVAKYWFDDLAGLPTAVDIASEHRYRRQPRPERVGAVFVSQSGETADTLAALRHCKEAGQRTLAVVNVMTSSIAREADRALPIMAGTEIGVASTKAFVCQLIALGVAAALAARERGLLAPSEEARLVDEIMKLPAQMDAVLAEETTIARVAQEIAESRDVLYLGRGAMYPIALEGALKLKEISYLHAEGYAAGELKHGPIALISNNVPVVVLAPSDALFEKTISNMQEVLARRGKVVLITDEAGAAEAGEGPWRTIVAPQVDPVWAPILYTVPIQLLAYHAAVARGTDVDQPRNLAKSVTVE